jgi:hypothetical protein
MDWTLRFNRFVFPSTLIECWLSVSSQSHCVLLIRFSRSRFNASVSLQQCFDNGLVSVIDRSTILSLFTKAVYYGQRATQMKWFTSQIPTNDTETTNNATTMANAGSSNVFHPGRENVHPLFDSIRFAEGIDYNGAFYDAAVLATRLINSPQGLQHDFAFFYGQTVPANVPAGYTGGEAPGQYACNKGIGQLDKTDIRNVERQRNLLADRVRFQVDDLTNMYGCCDTCAPQAGIPGSNSVITISRVVYNAALDQDQPPEGLAAVRLFLALLMIHELAHAAGNHLFGSRPCEDYRENSNVAEAGFEFESRFFGLKPWLFFKQEGRSEASAAWGIWQSHAAIARGYDLDNMARNVWKLPKGMHLFRADPKFILKLSDDAFWEGEYLERGALALIPDSIATLICSDYRGVLYTSIPLSIRDLFRKEGPSYAQKKYARFSNPERTLRVPAQVDEDGHALLGGRRRY